MTHKIKIKQGAVKFLRDMLSGSGWAKNVSDIILGGGLLVEKVPENVEPPVRTSAITTEAHAKAVREWTVVELPEFEITEKEREAIRRCLKHFADEAAIPPTAHAAELLMAFGYSAD